MPPHQHPASERYINNKARKPLGAFNVALHNLIAVSSIYFSIRTNSRPTFNGGWAFCEQLLNFADIAAGARASEIAQGTLTFRTRAPTDLLNCQLHHTHGSVMNGAGKAQVQNLLRYDSTTRCARLAAPLSESNEMELNC